MPPLTSLAAFEAAARHLSFKEAAKELSVTPGAVSQQIKALEQEVGAPLFLRKHRSVALTDDGETLYDALAVGFARISQSLKSIQDKRSSNTVTISSSSAFAGLWLSSSVIRFWREYPDIDVNHIIQDVRGPDTPDIDITIQYGRTNSEKLGHRELFSDQIVPVSDPATAQRLANCSLEDLADERLIHLETINRDWTSWSDWFRAQDYTGALSKGVRVNHYSVALHAAQEGGGIALGWRRLVEPMLKSGALAVIGRNSIPAPHRFYLVSGADVLPHSPVDKLKNWILADLRAGD
nr:LysR substrate-binding domain-containing protein [Leisingera sp. ANG59]